MRPRFQDACQAKLKIWMGSRRKLARSRRPGWGRADGLPLVLPTATTLAGPPLTAPALAAAAAAAAAAPTPSQTTFVYLLLITAVRNLQPMSSYIPTAFATSSENKACAGIREDFANCLLRTDCVLKHGRTPQECLQKHADELPEECQFLRKSLSTCKRGMVSGLVSQGAAQASPALGCVPAFLGTTLGSVTDLFASLILDCRLPARHAQTLPRQPVDDQQS
jgi:cytochrome c oxidase assembly factor 5